MPYPNLLKGRYSQTGQIYLVTTVTSKRAPFFANFDCGCLVVRELIELDRARMLESLAWVLMPDHLHWLFQLHADTLSGVVKQLKGRSAGKINAVLQRQGPVWQRGFHDHAVRKEEDWADLARYIVANPLRAGLVSKLGEYPFWNAKWLSDE